MQKIYLSIILFCLLSIIFVPVLVKAATDPACIGADGKYGIIQCGCGAPVIDPTTKNCTNCCEIGDFFIMLNNIYKFIVFTIATPLAVLALTIGGIFMLVSAGNPNLFGTGKKIIFVAIIGLVLTFCSWLIINFIMTTLGYSGTWNSL